MKARLGVCDVGVDRSWKGSGMVGEGDGERGVFVLIYPLMIKTLSQSCRQPDCCVSFLGPSGVREGMLCGPGCR
jgi:hypothetical protein